MEGPNTITNGITIGIAGDFTNAIQGDPSRSRKR
jgi:hypothetical protein